MQNFCYYIICCFLLICLPVSLRAQDRLITENNDTIQGEILNIGAYKIAFKPLEDPMFNTQNKRIRATKEVIDDDGRKLYKKTARPYIALLGGLSEPVSFLSSIEANFSSKKLMQSGLSAALEGGYYFYRNLGVQARLGGFQNGFNQSSIETPLIQNVNETTVDIKTHSWQGAQATLGPLVSFKPRHNFTIDGKIGGGVSMVRKPSFSYRHKDEVCNCYIYEFESPSATTLALTYSAGLNVRFKITRRLGVYVSSDYSVIQPTFEYTNAFRRKTDDDNLVNKKSYNTQYTPDIRAWQSGLGIVYHFYRK